MKTLVQPDQVYLRFPPNDPIPDSLLRPLSTDEQRAVNLFAIYYRDVIFPSGKTISDFLMPFKAVLEKNGIDVSGYTTKGRGPLFNGLFTYAPDVTILAGIRRAAGIANRPSAEEKRLLFRAIVDEHQKEHGLDALPGDPYFTKLQEERAFFPSIGLVVPDADMFYQDVKKQLGIDKTNYRQIYEFYFDIPEEIPEEVLQKNFPVFSLDNLKDNFLNVYVWMHENDPELPEEIPPGRAEVEQYANECGGIPWSVYAYEFDPRRTGRGGNTASEQRGIHWLRREMGLEPNAQTVDRNTHRLRIAAWTQETIFEQYVKAWVHLSNGLCDIERGIMVNPPRHADMNALGVAQTSAINAMCEADPGLAKNRNPIHIDPTFVNGNNIFLEEVPSMAEIQQFYPGGPQGLLKDIEDLLCKPHSRRVEFSPDREAQLAMLIDRHERFDKDPLRTIDAVRERISPRNRASSNVSTSTTEPASDPVSVSVDR